MNQDEKGITFFDKWQKKLNHLRNNFPNNTKYEQWEKFKI